MRQQISHRGATRSALPPLPPRPSKAHTRASASARLSLPPLPPQALHELLEDDDKFGFLVMDGNGCLFGTLQGNNREILHKFTVDLPKKHGRGGQSALRFARLRLEKRHNYVRKVRRRAPPRARIRDL